MLKKVFTIALCAIMCAAALGLTACSSPYKAYDDRNFVAGEKVYTDEVNEIDIDWLSGSVTVRYGDKGELSVSEASISGITDTLKVRTRFADGKLTVKFAASGAYMPAAFFKDLVVTVPAGTALTKLNVDCVAASISVTDVETDVVNLETVSGGVTASFADKATSIRAFTVSGSVSVNCGELGSFDIQSTSGTVGLSSYSAPGEGRLKTVSGGVNLCVAENSGFTLTAKTTSGSINCAFPVVVSGDKRVYGDGSREYSAQTVSGSVSVTKRG